MSFEPLDFEVLLASQLRPPSPLSPCQRLWIDVLTNTLRDYVGCAAGEKGADRAGCAQAAAEWLLDDTDGPQTYRWVCHILGLEPDAVRARLRAFMLPQEQATWTIVACEECHREVPEVVRCDGNGQIWHLVNSW